MQKRKIDPMGRVVIPKNLVKALQWEADTEIVFSEKDGALILEKAAQYCACCKNEEGLVPVNKNIFLCRSCLRKLSKEM